MIKLLARCALWIYSALAGGIAVAAVVLAVALFGWTALVAVGAMVLLAYVLPTRYRRNVRGAAIYVTVCVLNFAALAALGGAVVLGMRFHAEFAAWILLLLGVGWLLLRASRGAALAGHRGEAHGWRTSRDAFGRTSDTSPFWLAMLGTSAGALGSEELLTARSLTHDDGIDTGYEPRHDWIDDGSSTSSQVESMDINPATGLPMIGGIGGVDAMGNPYGFDHSDHSSFNHSSLDDSHGDDWTSGSSFGDD